MSHYCCKVCGQRYDDCHCRVHHLPAGYVTYEESLQRMELEDKIRKQYQEIKEIALSLGMKLE
jgi:hypothetical protein